MTIAYPLQWPKGRPRRAAALRKDPKFNRKEREYSKVGAGSWNVTREITIAVAIQRLQQELDRIGARHPVVSSNVELRLDGLPRLGRNAPDDPGVAVYFELSGKPHCLPCDVYTTVAGNIAAVAAHIEATRAIERHGVASVAEVFSGFVALPPPGSAPWWQVLQVSESATREEIEAAYRRLARERHPDRCGSHEMMAELNRARDEALQGARAA